MGVQYPEEAGGGATAGVDNTTYGGSWNGIEDVAPSKNAVYDKINVMDSTIAGKAPTLGEDDNYVTDAEKTALHSHSNKSTLDAIQEALTTALKSAYDAVVTWISTNGTNLLSHLSSTSNPHTVTKAQVGLTNVPDLNTTDAVNNQHTHTNKSTLDAIQEALTTALKSAYDVVVTWVSTNGANVLTHIGLTSGNPHSVSKTDVGLGSVVNADTTTTVNIADSTDKRFCTDAQKTIIGNTSGTNTGDSATPAETAQTIGTLIHGVAAKETIADTDKFAMIDTEASNVLKTGVWTLFKSTLKTYFDTLYNKYIHPNHSGDVTSEADGAQTIATAAVTNAKLANMATKTYKGRTSAETGAPEDVAVATLKTDLTLAKGDVGLGNVDNTSDVNKPVSTAQGTAINAIKAIQVANISLASGSWSLVGSYYQYDYANANITANSIVNVIPDNTTINIVITAELLPLTLSSAGSVRLYATNAPTGNITVHINITEKQ